MIIKIKEFELDTCDIERTDYNGCGCCWLTIWTKNGKEHCFGDGSYAGDGKHVQHIVADFKKLIYAINNIREESDEIVNCEKAGWGRVDYYRYGIYSNEGIK